MNRLVLLLRPQCASIPSLHILFSPPLSRLGTSLPRREFARCIRSLHVESATTNLASETALSSLSRVLSPARGENLVLEDDGLALPSSVYVHIPFCRRRCFYCDFPIVAVGERTDGNKAHMDAGMTDYVDLVCREIRLAAKVNPSRPLKTIFFGGGTPSLLPPPLLLRIIDTLHLHFGLESGAEISMEMDPGTFDVHSLRQLMDGGLNRVSMGVQSFQAEHLKSCGRAHDLREVYEAIEAIRACNWSNWSLDLISSLPHQSLQDWEYSIKEAVTASPSHISVYDLQIEEGTLFNKWYKAGQSPLPNDENSAEFYRMASAGLQDAGYVHYEISNYAKEGFHCRHNLVYWKNLPYFAFGLGSTSYVDGRRFSRPRSFKLYRQFVENFESSGGGIECLRDSKEERASDSVMLSLRLAQGLDIKDFSKKFGAELTSVICKALLQFVFSGHAVFLDADMHPLSIEVTASLLEDSELFQNETFNDIWTAGTLDHVSLAHVRLTDPAGFLLSNEVIASIFSALPSGESSEYAACATMLC